MNARHSVRFVSLLLLLCGVTAARAAEPTVRPPATNITPPSLIDPVKSAAMQCAAKGYACATGFNCSPNVTALGPSPDPNMTTLYACIPATSAGTCTTLCPPGWNAQGGVAGGSYSCTARPGLCRNELPLPAGGGYYCAINLGG